MRVLRVETNSGEVFYSPEWSYALVESVEKQAAESFGGVKSMELVLLGQSEYDRVYFEFGVQRMFKGA